MTQPLSGTSPVGWRAYAGFNAPIPYPLSPIAVLYLLSMTGAQGLRSAQDMAYSWLKQHIASLARHEGVFLTEGEVAAQAGTSRTPVREALFRLEAEGFLTIVPRKGAYVAPVPDSEIVAVMEARSVVEEWCVRRVTRSTGGLADELERLINEQEKCIGDAAAFIDCDRRFHRTIVQEAGNALLVRFYESLRDKQVRMGISAVSSTPDRARQVLVEHRAILDGIRGSDNAAVVNSVDSHLSNTLDVLLSPALRVRAPNPRAAVGDLG